ncbi:MAG: response regulator [Oscillospiraceae bacterium]
MINLLIVDDERHIADWLYELFTDGNDAEASGFEFECYRAYDADQALDIFGRYKVDILLSDIYMPGKSGLEMVEEIHESNPFCHVVFLTGYSEYDDIYRATRSRNTRYLSKTEEDEVIVGAVVEAARELTMEKERIDRTRLDQNMLLMLSQRELMLRLLQGEHDPADLTRERLRWYGIPLQPEQPVLLLTGRITETPDTFKPSVRLDVLNHMCLLFQTQFARSCELVQVDYRPSVLVWILQFRKTGEIPPVAKLRAMLEDFSAACYDTLEIGISLLIQEQPVELSKLSLHLSRAEESVGFLLSQERGIVLVAGGEVNDTLPQAGERINLHDAMRALTALQVSLEQGNRQKATQAMDKVLPVLAGFQSRYNLQAAELYFGIANVLIGCINRLNIMEEVAFQISLGRLSVWSDFATWQETAEYLGKLCDAVIGILEHKTRTGGDVVQRVTAFIDNHLGEDLSLTWSTPKNVYRNKVRLKQR